MEAKSFLNIDFGFRDESTWANLAFSRWGFVVLYEKSLTVGDWILLRTYTIRHDGSLY